MTCASREGKRGTKRRFMVDAHKTVRATIIPWVDLTDEVAWVAVFGHREHCHHNGLGNRLWIQAVGERVATCQRMGRVELAMVSRLIKTEANKD